ncbi:MAG TPA: hypothetical protein VFL85_01320 [Candidatus Saccharimonadales bacterium]|nr:hypothetical protein [Candidatus Saccharimonadales bacterium]
MPTFTMERTMEGQDEGDQYFRTGAFAAELHANDTHDDNARYQIGRDPELNMSDAARVSEATIGTRGIESTVSSRRRGVGYGTGHLILRKEHIGPEIFHG